MPLQEYALGQFSNIATKCFNFIGSILQLLEENILLEVGNSFQKTQTKILKNDR